VKRKEKNNIKLSKQKPKLGPTSGGAAIGNLLYSRNSPENLGSIEKSPTAPWKTICDPHAPVQGVTSLVHVGHAPSMKNWHDRGCRLLDRKKPASSVERRVSWKNQLK